MLESTILNSLNVGVIKFNTLGEINFINKFAQLKLKTSDNLLKIQDFLDCQDVEKYSQIYFSNKINPDPLKTFLFGVGPNKHSTLVWNLVSTNNKKIKSKITIKEILDSNQIEYLATIEDLRDEQLLSQKIQERNDIIKKISLESNVDEHFNLKDRIKKLLNILTDCLEVNRASVWIYDEKVINCFQLFEKDKNSYSEGIQLFEADFPAYFEEIKVFNFIKADNALIHRATKDFKDPYLDPLNIKSMVDTAVYLDGKIFAVICCEAVGEFKEWVQEDLIFLESVSKLVSLAFKDEKEYKNNINNINNAKLISLGEMSSSIAHEINNPLTSIQLKLELLIYKVQNNDLDFNTVEEELKSLITTSSRIGKIIKGLQKFSKNTENNEFTTICLQEVIENTLNLCEERITKQGIQLIKDITINRLYIKGNDVQISQVLVNLLNNSFDVLQDKKKSWIKISLHEIEGIPELRVSDSGDGIDPEIASKIMIPFFTTKDIGKGTGLGLSISKNIIDAHNGSFFLDPYSKNTSFVILFNNKKV